MRILQKSVQRHEVLSGETTSKCAKDEFRLHHRAKHDVLLCPRGEFLCDRRSGRSEVTDTGVRIKKILQAMLSRVSYSP